MATTPANPKQKQQVEQSQKAKAFVAHKMPEQWWYEGAVRDAVNGWPQVFDLANFHCIYCRKNLSATLEDLVNSTTDHLVPQCLFPNIKRKGQPTPAEESPNHIRNLVPSCTACNARKASWYPELGSPAWGTRKAYIAAARVEVDKRRRDYEATLVPHLRKGKPIVWDPRNQDHGDFL
jgi:5-methylcytosine-specific restriction endonuclease McrA